MVVSPQRHASKMASWIKTYCSCNKKTTTAPSLQIYQTNIHRNIRANIWAGVFLQSAGRILRTFHDLHVIILFPEVVSMTNICHCLCSKVTLHIYALFLVHIWFSSVRKLTFTLNPLTTPGFIPSDPGRFETLWVMRLISYRKQTRCSLRWTKQEIATHFLLPTSGSQAVNAVTAWGLM